MGLFNILIIVTQKNKKNNALVHLFILCDLSTLFSTLSPKTQFFKVQFAKTVQ